MRRSPRSTRLPRPRALTKKTRRIGLSLALLAGLSFNSPVIAQAKKTPAKKVEAVQVKGIAPRVIASAVVDFRQLARSQRQSKSIRQNVPLPIPEPKDIDDRIN